MNFLVSLLFLFPFFPSRFPFLSLHSYSCFDLSIWVSQSFLTALWNQINGVKMVMCIDVCVYVCEGTYVYVCMFMCGVYPYRGDGVGVVSLPVGRGWENHGGRNLIVSCIDRRKKKSLVIFFTVLDKIRLHLRKNDVKDGILVT